MPRTKGKDGRFIRTRQPWTPKEWENGYYDSRGRFRVYRPDYPRVYGGGYALRSHIVWWLESGKPVPQGADIHHANGIIDDDAFDNLQLIEHGKHTRLHRALGNKKLLCENCKQDFEISVRKFNARKREGLKIRFCSQDCYHKFPRSAEHRKSISRGVEKAHKARRVRCRA